MATVPLSGTNIRLLSGVPFSNDYKHSRWFDTSTAQESYFLGKTVVHSMTENTFQKIEGKNFISVNQNIDDLWGVNYVMFQNTSYNVKWFYGFVTKLEYRNKSTTHVHFEIDVLQTWMFTMNFKPSYVVREHCPLWEVDGSPIINTVDEGLNYGTNYETVNVLNWKPYNDILFMVIVMKETAHLSGTQKPQASINAVPQPLCYYVHPFRKDGTHVGVGIDTPEDTGLSDIVEVLNALAQNTLTVNNVVSIYVTDYLGIDVTYDEGFNMITVPSANFMQAIISDGTSSTTASTLYLQDVKSYTPKSAVFTNKYSDYRTSTESKLMMYPYTVLILDDMKGNRQTIKNEYIKGNDINMTVRGSMGTSNKTTYSVDNYLTKDNLEAADWFLSNLENAVLNNNPNDLPIITDMLSAYLQGNRNSIQNQLNSTIFNGWMDTMGSVMGGVSNSSANPSNMGEANPVGMVQSGMGVVKGMANTYFQTQGMIAKQKDINNTPPSLSKMGSNTYYDFGHNLNGLYLIKRQITPEYHKKLEDFFNIFGYKKNEVKVPNFHTRQYWNYVQTSGCVITGNFNNEDLQELKSVFDSGITLWHTDDIGNYALGNVVI
jgi:hypothetical protein